MANDRITSSEEEFNAAVTQFNTCKQSLQNAYLQMTNAVFQLDSSWNGEASEAFKTQYGKLSKNLQSSDTTIDTAINDIKTVIASHAEITDELSASFSALTDTTDPFAQG